VEFVWQAAPEAFLGDGVVSGVRAVHMHLGVPDATGRQTPQVIAGSDFTLDADLVIKALGFDPEDMHEMAGGDSLQLTRWGTVRVDFKRFMTNVDGVFAVGDIVRGASLVVWAIRDGRDAAAAMHSWLQEREADRPGDVTAAVAA
jgi:glutamate synthase (NADPH/NADH) small chain